MTELRANHHHIQRCELFLELEPKHSARARHVKAFRIFDHQAFVQTSPRFLETLFDLGRRMRGKNFGNLKLGR